MQQAEKNMSRGVDGCGEWERWEREVDKRMQQA